MATDTAEHHGHDAPAGDGGVPEHHPHTRKYLTVFGALVVLTGLELGVVYAGLPKTTLVILLIGLALAKAGAVALWFMHLADERRVLRLMVGLPLLFPPIYAVVLIAESFYRSHFQP
jgi:caa(3)-type oxidase subunit IV